MRSNKANNTSIRTSSEKSEKFYLPSGAKFSDIFMSASQIMKELDISKNTLLKWRAMNNLSYTLSPTGSIYYFRQEIAKILFERKVCNAKTIAKKLS